MNKSGRPLFFSINLQIIFGITLIAVLGVASITPAFPKIMQQFDLSPGQVGWLITVFTVPGILLTPLAGIFADRLGRKRIIVPALFVFGVAGLLCAFTSNFEWLLVLRAIQGTGAAPLGSLNTTLIGDLYQDNDRNAAMGYNASILSIGTASYPVIGGGLALFGWNYPFILPVAAIPLGFIVLLKLKNPEPQSRSAFFEYIKKACIHLNNRKVVILFLLSVVTFIMLYGSFLSFFPILMSERFSRNPLIIGILMSAMSFSTALTSSQLGRLSRIFAPGRLLGFAFFMYLISSTAIPNSNNILILTIPVMMYGIGQGLNIPTAQSALAGMAPLEYRAIFMSLNGMVLRLGQSSGPLLAGVVYSWLGLDWVFYSAGLISAFVIILLIISWRD